MIDLLSDYWSRHAFHASLSSAECEGGKAAASSSSSSSLARLYHCDICNKDLSLTSTEILKHKRQHTAAS